MDTAVAILRILDFATGPLSLSQIARAAGFLSSKTHHYLVSLMRTGLAKQDPITGLYSLGEYALRLGRAAHKRGTLAAHVGEVMQELSRTTRQTAVFTQWSSQGPVVMHVTNGRRTLTLTAHIGAVMPLSNSATGDIYLAWLPDRALARAGRDGLLDSLPGRQLEAVQARVRRDGASYSQGRRNAAIAGVAVPVFEANGALAGALTAVGLRGELDDVPESTVDRAVREAAARLSDGMDASHPLAPRVRKRRPRT